MKLDVSGRGGSYVHWTTPESFLDLVRAVGHIALDPCSNEASTVLAKHEWDHESGNGLPLSWSLWNDGGLVYVNPPYNEMVKWAKKISDEAALGVEIIALVPARTSPKWAHRMMNQCQAVCFWGPGRIQFDNPPPGPKNTSSLENAVYCFGSPGFVGRFCDVFQGKGKIWCNS